MFAIAGFPRAPGGKGVVNRCGQPANPKVTFLDLNGDGQPEALFIDRSACYAPDGSWFAILTGSGDNWHMVAGAPGAARGAASQTGGWQDIVWTSGGTMRTIHYNGTTYAADPGGPQPVPGMVTASDLSMNRVTPTPAASPAQPAAGRYPTDGWPKGVTATTLSSAQLAPIMAAADYKREGSGWAGCGGMTHVTATDVELTDLNGDGRPEAIITAGGTECYGVAGTGFDIVMAQPGGWREILGSNGIPAFQKYRAPGGWPDIEVGGPGFCFPVERWNGTKYDLDHWAYDGKPCRP